MVETLVFKKWAKGFSAIGSDVHEDGRQLMDELYEDALHMGECDPKWLLEKRFPKIEVTDLGEEGPTILLLHGLFGAMSNWDDFMPLAAKYARLRALQFPLLSGHRSEVRVKALALLTEYFIRAYCRPPVVLCGNSLGGHVALYVALHCPDLVDCLVLSGSSGLYEHTVDKIPLKPTPEFVIGQLERVFYSEKFCSEDRINEVSNILSNRGNFLNLLSAARSAKHDNLQDRLRDIKHKTLLLWGENDAVTPLSVAENFLSLLPNAELKTKACCGHAPMIECPEWFAAELEPFLRKNSVYYK